VVQAFADSMGALRPDLQRQALHVPLAMLLFGMMNWTFTWLRPGGALTHESLAPVVLQLLLGGLPAVRAPLAEVSLPG
jgi:Tetracyclin repressor-like, C-terminal domain